MELLTLTPSPPWPDLAQLPTQNLQYPLFFLTLCIPVVTQILARPLNPLLLSTSTTFAWVQILITNSLGYCGHALSGLPSLTQMLVPALP